MQTAFTIAGGLGLFLLGLTLMTDGLKGLAGSGMKRIITRTVRGPGSGVVTGAVATGLVQSSSATTMMTIGLVSAGLMTFNQSLGVVLGANIGTTSTSWLVALLGLKYSITSIAMPMIFIGAMMRMLGHGKVATGGLAIAGFGLLFIGIDMLSAGMGGFAERFTPADMPPATFSGRLLLLLLGIGLTVVTQSSSVAATVTLSALHAGAISIDQAATLIIAVNIGTTVSSAIAAIGATTPARRTALAHILFNLLTGVVAFLLLPVLGPALTTLGTDPADAGSGGVSPAILIAAFHTAFNLLGLLLFLPWLSHFSRLLVRLVPQRGPELTRFLDRSVTNIPHVATEAARRTGLEITLVVALEVQRLLKGDPRAGRSVQLDEAKEALHETARFLEESVRKSDAHEGRLAQRTALGAIHAIDHLLRLTEAAREVRVPRFVRSNPELASTRAEVAGAFADIVRVLGHPESDFAVPDPEALRAVVSHARTASLATAERRRSQRRSVLRQTASGAVSAEAGIEQIEGMRWLDRIAYHAWRAIHHLAGCEEDEPTSEVFPDSSTAPSSSNDGKP